MARVELSKYDLVGHYVKREHEIAQAQKHVDWLRANGQPVDDGLEAMAKGTATLSDVASAVPESLNSAVVSTLLQPKTRNAFIPHKLFPSVKSTDVVHKIPRLTQRGSAGTVSNVAEGGRPQRIDPGLDRLEMTLKLHAYSSAHTTHVMHADSVAPGSARLVEENARLAYLEDTARQMYFSDTRRTLGGTAGLAVKGIFQQIEEGTVNSDLVSDIVQGPGHVIDMLGASMSLNYIRVTAAQTLRNYLQANTIIGSPGAFMDLESQLDASLRGSIGGGIAPIRWGTMLKGMSVGGLDINFVPDFTLDPSQCQMTYERLVVDRKIAATVSAPAVIAVAAQTDDSTGDTVESRFDANPRGAGEFYYYVTQVVGGVESAGTRYPTSGLLTVTATQEVRLRFNCDTSASHLNVYRSYDGSSGAHKIFQVAGSTTGAVDFYDNNLYRPNTETAIALSMSGGITDMFRREDAYGALMSGADPEAFYTPITNDNAQDAGIVIANLGPRHGRFTLPPSGFMSDEVANFAIFAPMVVNPLQTVAIRNIIPGFLTA